MGRRVIALAAQDSDFRIVSGIDHAENPLLDQDVGAIAGIDPVDVPLQSQWLCHADVVIDFSLPTAVGECVANCVERKIPLVVATTGLSEALSKRHLLNQPELELCQEMSMRSCEGK